MDDYTKPSRLNPVAKHMRKFNREKVQRDKRKDYSRKGKNRWDFEHVANQ